MNVSSRSLAVFAAIVLAAQTVPAIAQSQDGTDASPAPAVAAFDRSAAVQDFLSTWQADAQSRGFDLVKWEADVRGILASRTADQINAAIAAKSYDDATRALGLRSFGANRLGDDATDLVFFPVAPCRIVDTRIATPPGRLVAGTPRNLGHNQQLAAQGGNAAGCGIPTDPAAIALNIVAVNPVGAGNMRAWRQGDPAPNAAVVNYAAVPGLNLANMVIVPTCQICGLDFTVQADVADVHLVADVVGYFWSPSSTCAAGQELHLGKCFETATRPVASVFTASDTCQGAGGRLPDPLELRSLRGLASFALADEWTDSIWSADGTTFFALTIADGGGFTRNGTLTTHPFRCAFDRHLPTNP